MEYFLYLCLALGLFIYLFILLCTASNEPLILSFICKSLNAIFSRMCMGSTQSSIHNSLHLDLQVKSGPWQKKACLFQCSVLAKQKCTHMRKFLWICTLLCLQFKAPCVHF